MTSDHSLVAVVTIAHGRHHHLAGQHRSLALGSRRPDVYVVVSMNDAAIVASTDHGLARQVVHVDAGADGLPLAAARNRGVDAAVDRGADTLVLLDVDCMAGSYLVAGYADAVADRPDRLWSGPVTYLPQGVEVSHPADLAALDRPHPARPMPGPGSYERSPDPSLFWSLSFATSAATWRRIGGFHEAYLGYGGEDTDFAFVAQAAGVESWWTGAARAFHQHHSVSSPPVEHVDDILRNGRIFRERWGHWPMQGWLDAFERRGLVRPSNGDYVRAETRPAP